MKRRAFACKGVPLQYLTHACADGMIVLDSKKDTTAFDFELTSKFHTVSLIKAMLRSKQLLEVSFLHCATLDF